ncbi:MAG: TIGR03084 family metal-binding protein [Propionibacteriales bacterium]|nr:TIGR03084 family metal-binding protein [Propionibacteriales bacterium]
MIADLVAESEELDALVADIEPDRWSIMTPAKGWTIAHQIAHLAWTDEFALLAVTDEPAFRADLQRGLGAAASVDEYVDSCAEAGARNEPGDLLRDWRVGRDRLATALAAVPAGTVLPWLGPSMSPASMATARLMETWAHGQDVADALGVDRKPTQRLKHVAHIGVRARAFAYAANGLDAPSVDVRVELVAPDGDLWTWGDADAENQVSGPALDFGLLATQRRHRADLALVTTGAIADQWLDIAQAFAGPPGAGRALGQFS